MINPNNIGPPVVNLILTFPPANAEFLANAAVNINFTWTSPGNGNCFKFTLTKGEYKGTYNFLNSPWIQVNSFPEPGLYSWQVTANDQYMSQASNFHVRGHRMSPREAKWLQRLPTVQPSRILLDPPMLMWPGNNAIFPQSPGPVNNQSSRLFSWAPVVGQTYILSIKPVANPRNELGWGAERNFVQLYPRVPGSYTWNVQALGICGRVSPISETRSFQVLQNENIQFDQNTPLFEKQPTQQILKSRKMKLKKLKKTRKHF